MQDWPFTHRVTPFADDSGFSRAEVKQLISSEIDRLPGSAVGDAAKKKQAKLVKVVVKNYQAALKIKKQIPPWSDRPAVRDFLTAKVMKELADYKDKLTEGHVELEEVFSGMGKVFAEELPEIYSNIVQLNKEIIWYVSANVAISYWETLTEPDEQRKLPKVKKDKLKKPLGVIDSYSGCPQFEKEIGCNIMADIHKATHTPLDVQGTGKDAGKSASGVGPTDAPPVCRL